MNERTILPLATVLLLLAGTVANARPVNGAGPVPIQSVVEEVELKKQSYVHPDPEIPVPQEPVAQEVTAADRERHAFDQQLWDLLGRGELTTLRRRIDKRQEQFPGWQPPTALSVELERAEVRAKISAARKDPERLIALRQRYPERFSCREYYHLWSLADAYDMVKQPILTAEIHGQMVERCRDPEVLLTTLDRIAEREGPEAALAAAARVQARRGIKLPAAALEKRRFGWHVNLAVALRDAGRSEEAATHLAAIESGVMSRRDVGLGRLMAWNYRERGDSAAAAGWFRRVTTWSGDEEDRLHLLQHQWDAEDRVAVIDALRNEPLKTSEARLWAASVLRGEAARKFDGRAHAEAISLLDAALAYDNPEPASLSAMRGWAYLELGRHGDAHRAFAEAYRATPNTNLAGGLLYAAHRSGDWHSLLAVADSAGGPVLGNDGERALAMQLAQGELNTAQVTVQEGHLVPVEDEEGAFTRATSSLEGLPGYTWGSLDADDEGDSSGSLIINQGIDWVKFPGDITLNTFVEYRAINNERLYFRDETEGAVGVELRRAPFHLGVEYLPEGWRNGDKMEGDDRKAYLSWYQDWYDYLRRKRGNRSNPLNADAYSGASYGRITHDLDGEGGTSLLGFVRHGVDWFTFAGDVTFNTYAAYRFRFRDWNDYWYDAHGPALGIELQKGPFAAGIDYTWKISPHQETTTRNTGVYLNWYYGWDLKSE